VLMEARVRRKRAPQFRRNVCGFATKLAYFVEDADSTADVWALPISEWRTPRLQVRARDLPIPPRPSRIPIRLHSLAEEGAMVGIISPARQTSWPYADCTSSSERERLRTQPPAYVS
jgi:hypothetical protein